MKEINDNNFELEVLTSNTPVVVDFRAPWCGPCRMLGPVLENLSGEYEGKAKFVKINVDENPSTAIKYNIQGIPTVMIFYQGQPKETLVGVKPIEIYKNILDTLCSGSSDIDQKLTTDKNIFEIIGKDKFENGLKTNKLVLVDFRAPWCGPCRMLGPVLENFADQMKNEITVIKINVDEPQNQEIAMDFGISGIPHVILFKNGQQIDYFIGALPADQVKAIIQKNI